MKPYVNLLIKRVVVAKYKYRKIINLTMIHPLNHIQQDNINMKSE